MASNHEPTEQEWRELARQAIEEEDPDKALDLAQQIVEKYDEAQRSTGYVKDKKRRFAKVLERITGRNPSL